jgi:hypothetical protein
MLTHDVTGLPSIVAPMLVPAGSEDRATPPELGALIAGVVPGGQ